MAGRRLDISIMQQALNVRARAATNAEAAALLGVPKRTLENRLAEAKRLGLQTGSNVDDPNSPLALRTQVNRLQAELAVASRSSAQAADIKRVINTISLAVDRLEVPEWLIEPPHAPAANGVPTLMLSDWHGGEVVVPSQINNVNEYNVRIMRERAATLIDSAVHLLKIIDPKMRYPGLVLPLAGDMVTGNIHEELTATNEIQSMPAVLELFEILAGIIGKLVDMFGRLFIPCVGGNHGRDTKRTWHKDRQHTSFDWLIYQFLARRFAGDKRITFYIPQSTGAYYKIYSHRYWLVHGDGFRGGDGMIGCLGPIIRGDHKMRSRNAQIDQPYDTMILGHFHQYLHHGRVIVNGSLKGYDEYAFDQGFGFEPPQQALWLTHPKYGITYRMPVYVDNKRAPARTDWVSVPAK